MTRDTSQMRERATFADTADTVRTVISEWLLAESPESPSPPLTCQNNGHRDDGDEDNDTETPSSTESTISSPCLSDQDEDEWGVDAPLFLQM